MDFLGIFIEWFSCCLNTYLAAKENQVVAWKVVTGSLIVKIRAHGLVF
jgi:hypothetical protein